ncbi:hypothetical protein WJX77_002956 [Trebouxia sp. C0004]
MGSRPSGLKARTLPAAAHSSSTTAAQAQHGICYEIGRQVKLVFLNCLRDGKTTWEDLELGDIDLRLKWSGLFHRRKRTPGFFMMRLKARFLGGAVRKYGEKGCLDITTRANIQLRGVPLEDAGDIMKTAGCGPYFCTDWHGQCA